MKFSVLFEEILTRKYRGPRCSSAFACKFVAVFVALVLPLALTFVTQGMWKKFGEYSEQAAVQFKYRYILMARGGRVGEYFLWSSYPIVNQAEHAHLRPAVVGAVETDDDNDGKNDRISITVRFPLAANESVVGIFWMFLFTYQLEMKSRFSMEGALMGDAERARPISGLSVTGDLFLDQRALLANSGRDAQHGGPLINESRADVLHYFPREVLLRNSLRNFSLTLNRKTEVWTSEGSDFNLELLVRVPEQIYRYRTGLFELLKWAWIQYFSIFFVVRFIVFKIVHFLFVNRILDTVVADDGH